MLKTEVQKPIAYSLQLNAKKYANNFPDDRH